MASALPAAWPIGRLYAHVFAVRFARNGDYEISRCVPLDEMSQRRRRRRKNVMRQVSLCLCPWWRARARERSSVTRYQQNSSRVYCESEFNRPQANRINNINRLRWSVITQYRVKIRVPISVMGVCRRRSTHTHTQIDSLTDERKNGNKTKYSYLFLLPVVFSISPRMS